MAEQENYSSIGTRPSKKRSFPTTAAAKAQQTPATKKRVVLGDVTNVSVSQSSDLGSTPVPGAKMKHTMKKNKQGVEEHVLNEVPVELEDTQKSGYASFIYQHLHSLEMEKKRRPLSDYMVKVQKDITEGMREVLVDWLIEVAEEYKLVSDTLYLSVSFIDRYLSSHDLSRNRLQLLGVSSMLVASKYEEITPPHVEDFCYITDNTYTKEEVVDMERDVLEMLNFEISNPTIKTFLRIFVRASQELSTQSSLQFEFLSWFLAELSLLDYACVQFFPSLVAASAIFLARFTIQPEKHPWVLGLEQCSGYIPSELKDCVLLIHELQLSRRGGSLRAIREKYMHHKFKCVAALPCPSKIPASYFEATYK